MSELRLERYRPRMQVPSSSCRTGAEQTHFGAIDVAVVSHVLPLSVERTIEAPTSCEMLGNVFQLKSLALFSFWPSFSFHAKKVQTSAPSSSCAMCGSRSSSGPSKSTAGD